MRAYTCDICKTVFQWETGVSQAYGPIEGDCVVFCSRHCANEARAEPGGIDVYFEDRVKLKKVVGRGFKEWKRREKYVH